MSNRFRTATFAGFIIAFAILLIPIDSTHAAGILDQQQLLYNGGTSARTLPGYTVWQSFTAGISGTLTEIDMGFFNNMSGDGQLRILAGDGTGGPVLQFLTVPVFGITQPGVTWNNWDVNVPVVAGSHYTFNLILNAATLPDPYGVAVGPGNPYSGGVMGLDDPAGTHPTNFDLVFRTFVSSATSVPEPASLVLVGIGAIAVLAFRFRYVPSNSINRARVGRIPL